MSYKQLSIAYTTIAPLICSYTMTIYIVRKQHTIYGHPHKLDMVTLEILVIMHESKIYTTWSPRLPYT